MSADGSAKRQGSPLEGARRGVVKASLFDDDSGDDATGFDTNDHEMDSDGTNEDGANDDFIHESGSPRNEEHHHSPEDETPVVVDVATTVPQHVFEARVRRKLGAIMTPTIAASDMVEFIGLVPRCDGINVYPVEEGSGGEFNWGDMTVDKSYKMLSDYNGHDLRGFAFDVDDDSMIVKVSLDNPLATLVQYIMVSIGSGYNIPAVEAIRALNIAELGVVNSDLLHDAAQCVRVEDAANPLGTKFANSYTAIKDRGETIGPFWRTVHDCFGEEFPAEQLALLVSGSLMVAMVAGVLQLSAENGVQTRLLTIDDTSAVFAATGCVADIVKTVVAEFAIQFKRFTSTTDGRVVASPGRVRDDDFNPFEFSCTALPTAGPDDRRGGSSPLSLRASDDDGPLLSGSARGRSSPDPSEGGLSQDPSSGGVLNKIFVGDFSRDSDDYDAYLDHFTDVITFARKKYLEFKNVPFGEAEIWFTKTTFSPAGQTEVADMYDELQCLLSIFMKNAVGYFVLKDDAVPSECRGIHGIPLATGTLYPLSLSFPTHFESNTSSFRLLQKMCVQHPDNRNFWIPFNATNNTTVGVSLLIATMMSFAKWGKLILERPYTPTDKKRDRDYWPRPDELAFIPHVMTNTSAENDFGVFIVGSGHNGGRSPVTTVFTETDVVGTIPFVLPTHRYTIGLNDQKIIRYSADSGKTPSAPKIVHANGKYSVHTVLDISSDDAAAILERFSALQPVTDAWVVDADEDCNEDYDFFDSVIRPLIRVMVETAPAWTAAILTQYNDDGLEVTPTAAAVDALSHDTMRCFIDAVWKCTLSWSNKKHVAFCGLGGTGKSQIQHGIDALFGVPGAGLLLTINSGKGEDPFWASKFEDELNRCYAPGVMKYACAYSVDSMKGSGSQFPEKLTTAVICSPGVDVKLPVEKKFNDSVVRLMHGFGLVSFHNPPESDEVEACVRGTMTVKRAMTMKISGGSGTGEAERRQEVVPPFTQLRDPKLSGTTIASDPKTVDDMANNPAQSVGLLGGLLFVRNHLARFNLKIDGCPLYDHLCDVFILRDTQIVRDTIIEIVESSDYAQEVDVQDARGRRSKLVYSHMISLKALLDAVKTKTTLVSTPNLLKEHVPGGEANVKKAVVCSKCHTGFRGGASWARAGLEDLGAQGDVNGALHALMSSPCRGVGGTVHEWTHSCALIGHKM